MNRRGLLLGAVLIALGGGLYGLSEYVYRHRHQTPPGGPTFDDAAGESGPAPTAGAPPRAEATADEGLSGGGRDPGPTNGSGAILARVVRASDRLALTGILVRVEGMSAAGSRVNRPVWTDARGDARFDDVPVGGAYVVHVQRDPNPPVDRTGVTVAVGEVTDLGHIALEAVGIIDALVLDEARKPIEGATVTVSLDTGVVVETPASPWPLEAELPGAFAKGATDDRGRLRLEGVPPGPVAVRATSPNHRARTYRAFVPAEPPKTAFVPFVLATGRAYGGRVIDADGRPVAGATVEFGFDGVAAFEARASVRTAEDGAFSLGGCERLDAYDLRVSAAGYATAIVSPSPLDGIDRRRTARRPIEPKPLEIVLDRNSTLAVVVLDAKSGAAVASARVRATPAWLPSPSGIPEVRVTYEGRSDVLGLASLTVPARRLLDLEIVGEAHRTFTTAHSGGSVVAQGGQLVGDLMSGPLAGERREVSALLERGYALWGKVTSDFEELAPIPGALVELRQGERRVFLVRTEADGHFERKDEFLPDRGPTLAVTAPAGFYPGSWTIDRPPGPDGVVNVHLTLHPLERSLEINGRVVDAERRPVAGALVRITDRSLMALTGADGTFAFVGVPRRIDPFAATPTSVPLLASKGGARASRTQAVPKSVDGDKVDFGDVRLQPVAEVTGVVLVGKTSDRARYPLVELIDARSKAVVDSLVGGEFGDYRFVDRVGGVYRVRARDGTRGGGRAVVIENGQSRPSFCEVRLVEATICAGRVEDRRDRKPIEGVVVRLTCQEPRDNEGDASLSEGSTITDGAGAFRFRCFGARPDSFFLIEQRRDNRERERRENADSGEDNVIRVDRDEVKPPVRR
jgi:hypothetical protein